MRYSYLAAAAGFLYVGLSLSACSRTVASDVGHHAQGAEATTEQCYVVSDVMDGNGEDILYIVDKNDNDPNTNLEVIGGLGMGVNNVEAIAIDPTTNMLYGADAGQLGTIDFNTGAFTALPQRFGIAGGGDGPINLNDVDGLSFDPTDGRLYGTHRREGAPDLLFVINKTNGRHLQNVFGGGVDYVAIPPIDNNVDIDDLAIDIDDGQMYAIANNGGQGDRLIRVDKMTGQSQDVGATVINDIEGLGFDTEGQMWGSAGLLNQLYRINKITGEAANAVPISMSTDFEAVDCLTSRAPDTPDAGPGDPDAGDGPDAGSGDQPDASGSGINDDEFSVIGGGCSAAAPHGSAWLALIGAMIFGLTRRRRTAPRTDRARRRG